VTVQSPDAQNASVELLLDTYRVTGELVFAGSARRLVDILNSVDVNYVVVRNAKIDDPWTEGDTPQNFIAIQVHLDNILIAIPRGEGVQHADQFEAVKKVSHSSLIALPNYEISGRVYLVPEISPDTAQMLTRHFTPVTDAEITAVPNKSVRWQEPLAVVNLSRAVLFATRAGTKAA
jgi:hypothetical protein